MTQATKSAKTDCVDQFHAGIAEPKMCTQAEKIIGFTVNADGNFRVIG